MIGFKPRVNYAKSFPKLTARKVLVSWQRARSDAGIECKGKNEMNIGLLLLRFNVGMILAADGVEEWFGRLGSPGVGR